jgi:hypothetical protein
MALYRGDYDNSFRVAMVEPVPEPSMMVIGKLFGLGGLMAKRRMKKYPFFLWEIYV